MKVERQAVVPLLIAIGYKGAKKYDEETLMKRLVELHENIPEEPVPEEYKELFEKIVRTGKKGKPFEIVDGEEAEEAEEKPAKGKKKAEKSDAAETKKSTKKADKPAKKAAKKETVAKDRFGAREGSGAWEINAALGKKPKMATAVAQETGLVISRVRSHLYSLTKAGFIEYTDDGYKVVESDGESKAKAKKKSA